MKSPFLTSLGSSDKGKAKINDDIRPLHPFERYGILYQMPSCLMKPFEDKYRAKSALFGFYHMDFVAAFPLGKN
ncbi:hypothetical protein H5410_031716 [Solanum commersonii]|uniref:Uncharacterized protein n=1 Tax=Solanum commersonii TaxID=4109 RepID=A0A9J5YJ21_SOLCO|nr:hypothetical protein H5410_031716 [Solanum commersonii]